MSSKGLKRPLEPESVLNSDDDLSSPEYLLTLQPVADDYVSDDEARKKSKTTQKRPDKSVILSRYSYSTKFSGTEVLFFFDPLFNPQPPPKDLASLPVVKVLEQILKFLYSDTVADSDNEFIKDESSVTEIYSYYLKKFKWLSYMNDNDNLNLKSCTKTEFWKKHSCILNDACNVPEIEGRYLLAISKLLLNVRKEYVENECKNPHSWKNLFTYIQPIFDLNDSTPNKSYISLSHKGDATSTFNYLVPTHLVSAGNKSKVAEPSDINICPKFTFKTVYRQHEKEESIGKIVIEVYDPESGGFSSEDEVKKCKSEEEKINTSSAVEKPKRETDAIFAESYKSKAIAYLKQSLPYDCQDSHTAKTLTGQHALQLIALADEHSRQIRKVEYKKLVNVANPIYRAFGMFLKNEYILFSKLKINHDKLLSYYRPAAWSAYQLAELEEGEISFSHWRLDVMQPNHRIALIVAMLEILKPAEE